MNSATPEHSVIVFQMGKVGSKTVQASLQAAYQALGRTVDVHHSHILARFDESEQIIRRERPNPEPSLAAIADGRKLKALIDGSPDHTWMIVSLVRDPVARNIAVFFDNLHEFVPDWRARAGGDPSLLRELQDAFLKETTLHSEPERWFDEQMASVFHVDVYAAPFPVHKGYQIYNPGSRTPVMVMRLEDLDACAPAAVKEFLDLENFSLRNVNLGYDKDYAGLYAEFKALPLPDHYLDAMYGTRYAHQFYSAQERARFREHWKNPDSGSRAAAQDPVNTDPILVYQMGKVGSKSVEQSLVRAYQDLGLNVPVHHVHFLNFLEERRAALQQQAAPAHVLKKDQEAQAVLDMIRDNPGGRWKVISLVRDPIARTVAGFFQNLDQFVPGWKERFTGGRRDLDELREIFLDRAHPDLPESWFDSQMKPVIGVDVYASQFPREAGYKIYREHPGFPLLVMRLEDLDRCAPRAMREFLGLSDFQLVPDNLGEQKEYADLYKAFKQVHLPDAYVRRIYDGKFARHFYTRDELVRFAQKWTGRPFTLAPLPAAGVRSADDEAAQLRARIAGLESQVREIQGSLAFRLLARYRRLVESAFPQSTLRRRLYDSFVSGARRLLGGLVRRAGAGPSPAGTGVSVRPSILGAGAPDRLRARYAGREIPELGYATVRDFCDSADHLPQISPAVGELKDVQRPWMVKAVLGGVPAGARLLEIGAGEPLVSGALRELGYHVTIIDPYDGAGNGPQAFDQYVRQYPDLKFVRAYFGRDVAALRDEQFDCIFSVSVLEHVPHEKLAGLFAGIEQYLRPGGRSIHCIDYTVLGLTSDWALAGLREMLFRQVRLRQPGGDEARTHGEADEMLEALRRRMLEDVETYYNSPLGHQLWRGGKTYEQFPYRKTVSIQSCVSKK